MFDITGLITFSNLIFVFSTVMIVGGCIWLFGLYFAKIIRVIPPFLIEVILYNSLIFAIYLSPKLFSSDTAFAWGLLFALGMSATTLLTAHRIKKENSQIYNFYVINMLIHAVVGIYLQSFLICSISVAFFMMFIGFHMGFGQGYIVLGYTDKNVIASATVTSGIVTIFGSVLRIMLDNSNSNSISTSPSLSYFMHYTQYFVPGMIWLGPYVFFLSMLITSSKYYCTYYNSAMYAINNILNISLSVVAIFLGNVYNIPQLSGFGGTFFTLYFTQKYIEVMPNRKEVWAASSILIGILLYLVNVYFRAEIETHGLQEYFHLFPPIPTTVMIN